MIALTQPSCHNRLKSINSFSVSLLGSNWRSNFDRYLHIFAAGVIAERPDGQYIGFSSNSGVYTPDTDIDYSLTNSGATWTLTCPDDTVETYRPHCTICSKLHAKRKAEQNQRLSFCA